MKQRILKKPMFFFLLTNLFMLLIFGLIKALSEQRGESQIVVLLSLSAITLIMLLYMLLKRENKYGRVLSQLHYYCLPEAFITEVRILLRAEQEKETPKDIDLLQLYLSIGFYAAGRFNEAMETLENIKIYYHYKNAPFIANYFHRKFLISLEIERQDVAWGSLVMMRQALGNIRKRKALQVFTRIYNEDMHILNAIRGNYEGVEEVFRGMLERGQTNYERSFASYLLGGVYKHLGKEAEAEDAYKYVLAWGNKLYIAGKSAEVLGLKGWEA